MSQSTKRFQILLGTIKHAAVAPTSFNNYHLSMLEALRLTSEPPLNLGQACLVSPRISPGRRVASVGKRSKVLT